MDFSGVISPEDIAEVEHEVNVAISKNIPIEVTYPVQGMSLRSWSTEAKSRLKDRSE